MTECERIIAEGILPESFFEEEVRCDFLVTKERKKIWAIELDLLLKFDEVCNKHQLRYFLEGGTLLGAIRHNGFIPWDDDIDVGMMRSDYEKLIEIGSEAFQTPYFLQVPGKDHGYFFSFAKLKNSNTSRVSYTFRYEKFNHGIGIDIFPYDNALVEGLQERYERINSLILENSTNMRRSNPTPSEKDLERLKRFPKRDPQIVLAEMEEEVCKYRNEKTDYVNCAVFTGYGAEKLIFKKNSFADVVLHNFENFKFPIPIGYEEILTTVYGDYMKYPPVEERGTWHTGDLLDTDNPYTNYIGKNWVL